MDEPEEGARTTAKTRDQSHSARRNEGKSACVGASAQHSFPSTVPFSPMPAMCIRGTDDVNNTEESLVSPMMARKEWTEV